MELSDVTIALRRHWAVAALAMVFWLLVGAFLALTPEAQYQTSATLLVGPAAQDSSVEAVNFQMPAIEAVLESSSFRRKIRQTLPADVAGAPVSISADITAGSGIVFVSVKGPKPRADAAWATALVKGIIGEDVANPSIVQATVLDEAGVPSTPVSPKRTPIFLGTIVLGLISAVFASSVMFRARKALNVVEEIERRLGVPVIGRIPLQRSLQRASGDSASDILLTTPRLTEAFQALRTNLELAFLGTPIETQVVALASWGEGVGKSTVAAGLAMTSAQSGTEVLAVDVDLRRPELHARLGEPFGPGTADAARRPVEKLVIRTRQPRLWMLPAGMTDRHPADILAVALEPILSFARSRSWRVVLDVPPYHGVAETAMVLSAARYVVLVVDARRAKLPELESMTSRLRASGVNIVGVALNRVAKSRMDSAYGPYSPGSTKPERSTSRRESPPAPSREVAAEPLRRREVGQARVQTDPDV